MSQTDAHSWSAVVPLAAPLPLSDGYPRHHPSNERLSAELRRQTAEVKWSELTWPALGDALLAAGRTDIPLSRLVEGHADAHRILHQASRQPVPTALYGVWASRSQQTGITARRAGSNWLLTGSLRFASGIGVLDRALIPVWPEPDHHILLDVGLDQVGAPELSVDTEQWATTAMEVSRSHTLTFDGFAVPVTAEVGPSDFYLNRPGFFPGGVGVAACWLGGAVRVADLVRARLRPPLAPDLQGRLGRLRGALVSGAAVLAAGLHALQAADPAVAAEGRAIATETRYAVAAAVHEVLDQAHRISGPAGLAYDRDLTRAVHDLRLYVLQSNADADAAYLGAGAAC